ncbi:hypothetical protein TrispH2_002343 [Trichoplax sp. H2]|uniref:Uncharacterized protein n=1 Tax=Trichoplax adhaerens TaxID=10228 RepID=B3RPR8_TRIAD|nr:hypothetical protein TRIADDRAFT_53639 [Trichoplax adhaerens]EDV28232.1 hypothetical protein TRIADDRAFT_53639 [Trichoplax adhaerens]RDD45306.1 hypothetical protein TrispH2_002343 [Trichoplax sp. H2]|eukprot:XP_002110066.1 hypothetical protein TRIADDRAFT_53639 [Trichoplax adhaerens]
MAAALYESDDLTQWTVALSRYEDVLKARFTATGNRKPRADVVALDNWYQNQLPKAINKRKEKHILKSELVKLMEWKLSRGKFRPGLGQMIKKNEDKQVIDISKEAFSKLPDRLAACNKLTELKAVGPATASAILCAACPESVPFMADESMAGVASLGMIKYDISYFNKYTQKIVDRAKKLNKAEESDNWNAHKVELALWAAEISTKFNIPLENVNKRKADGDGQQLITKMLKT